MSESEKWTRMLKAMASVLPADPYAPITREMVQEVMRRAQAATQQDDTEQRMLAEHTRLRDGDGTPDELADYDAARRMIQRGE